MTARKRGESTDRNLAAARSVHWICRIVSLVTFVSAGVPTE